MGADVPLMLGGGGVPASQKGSVHSSPTPGHPVSKSLRPHLSRFTYVHGVCCPRPS